MKFLLIDGNSIINRAFYAVPLLTNKEGEPTNGLYGFLNIFFSQWDMEKPDGAAVAFDLRAPTFRHLMYGEYKGTRKAMPDELRPQIPALKALLASMGIKIVEREGLEADDLLGSLAVRAEAAGHEAVVVSGDKDLLQIASEKIRVNLPKTKMGKTEVEKYYAADVFAAFGVSPSEYIDVKALMGDASDNIPGVPGIGEKTAVSLIAKYHSIEAAHDHASELTPKRASANIVEFWEQAVLSKTLATIKTDAEFDFPLEALALDKEAMFNGDAFREFKRNGFHSFFGRFANVKSNAAKVTSDVTNAEQGFRFKEYADKSGLSGLSEELAKKELVAYKLIFAADGLEGVAFSYQAGQGLYARRAFPMSEAEFLGFFTSFFESPPKKIALNLKEDLKYLKRVGAAPQNAVFDVALGAYVLNSSKEKYEYNDIASEFLDESYPAAAEFRKGRHGQVSMFENASDDGYAEFSARIAEVIFRAYGVMLAELEKNGQTELYYNLEHPLIYVLRDMESAGIRIDRDFLREFGQKSDAAIAKLEAEIYEAAGERFNINSPRQLGIILFEQLGLKSDKKTKSGYSTAAEVLEKIRDDHPIIPKILEYRTFSKLKSTYVDGLLAAAHDDGKIYGTFNQTITSTGRISSTEPNLQNIPIRTELGRELRKVFIPSDDSFVFVDADYSQIELRILAHIADDEVFINAFAEGQDIHRLTASQVFGVPYGEVTAAMRGDAKAVNFGIVYGISAYRLSQELGISVKSAGKYIEDYFEKYPAVKRYLDASIDSAKKTGYAETIFHRRRSVPELGSKNFVSRGFGERVAMNMPIQGSAADIIKIAMLRVFNRLRDEGLRSRLILQIHDELLIEASTDELDRVCSIVREEMENAAHLRVPLTVDVKCGKSWFEAH